jgi:hypothetical protein
MADWFRSITILLTAFVGVIVLTLVIAAVIVPAGAPVAEPAADGSDRPAATERPIAEWTPGEIGGTLAVTGDRTAALAVEREELDLGYALAGADGRIAFDTDPLDVAQIRVDDLEIYLDPGACELTPGERDDLTGVAALGIRCVDVDDVRDKGTVSVEGTIGIAADLLGLRGGLPEPGGTLTIAGEPEAFGDSRLTVPPVHRTTPTYVGQLVSTEGGVALTLTYGDAFHIEEVQTSAGFVVVPSGACSVTDREIGVLNPHTRIVELAISCDELDLPPAEPVAIDGTLLVEVVEMPG